MPSLNAIRVFEAAARHRNFSRAADELNVTQSAVSRQVQKLEQQLGQALFVRKGPRLMLTRTGEEYLEIVQDGLAVIRRGTDRLFRVRERPVLTISVLPSLVADWLVPPIAAFEARHPQTSVRLSAAYRVVDFSIDTDIDAAIRFGAGVWPGVDADVLVDDIVVPVCSPVKAARLRAPADLLKERLIRDDERYDLWGVWGKAAGIENLSATDDRLSDDFNVQIQGAMLGHGIALARGLLVADDLRRGRLVCPFRIAVRSPLQYYFVVPSSRPVDPGIDALRSWLKQAAATSVEGMEAYWGEPIS